MLHTLLKAGVAAICCTNKLQQLVAPISCMWSSLLHTTRGLSQSEFSFQNNYWPLFPGMRLQWCNAIVAAYQSFDSLTRKFPFFSWSPLFWVHRLQLRIPLGRFHISRSPQLLCRHYKRNWSYVTLLHNFFCSYTM